MKTIDDAREADGLIQSIHSLPLEKQLDIFMLLPPVAREAFVGNVAKPREILCHVSEEEFFFTVKQLGETNALELLTHCTDSQLLYSIDLEFWKKDMLDFTAAIRWLRIIATLGEDRIVQFVKVVDPELLVSVFRSLVRVQARDPDLDLLDQSDTLPLFTLDDTFFVEFLLDDVEDLMRTFFEQIFYWDSTYYFSLMHSLASDVASENEEMAVKWHHARLADKGFPVFEEALEIYRYLQPFEITPPITAGAAILPELEDQQKLLLTYPLKVIPNDSLLRRALEKILDPAEKDRIVVELAHVANKVMVADGRDAGNPEDLYSSLDKVSGCINMTLEELWGDNADADDAAGTLLSNHMEILFRRGFSLILDLRKHAQAFVRDYEGGLENLGFPLAGLVRGLFQKRPNFSGDLLGEKNPRVFRSIADLAIIKRLLDKDAIEQAWERM